jgi:hypothetical protein
MPTFSRPRRMAIKLAEPERYAQSGLDALAAAIREPAKTAGLVRERGGRARGIWWCEMSGRLVDGAWVELRLHARQDGRIQAGMLLYQPLARGGRTLPIGDITADGDGSAARAMTLLASIEGWLRSITPKKKGQRA